MNTLMEKLEHATKYIDKVTPKWSLIHKVSIVAFVASAFAFGISSYIDGVNNGAKIIVDGVNNEL